MQTQTHTYTHSDRHAQRHRETQTHRRTHTHTQMETPNRPAETGHPLDIGPLPPHFLPSNPNCQMAGAEQRNPSHLDSGLLISLRFLWHTTGTAQEVSAMATESQHTVLEL